MSPTSNQSFCVEESIILALITICLHNVLPQSSFSTEHANAEGRSEPARSRIWYVSHWNGTTSPGCGSQDFPCWSITTVLKRAGHGDWVYLDGTETKRQPYTCNQASSSDIIFINKSLSIKGIQTPAHIQCGNGMGFHFFCGRTSQLTVQLSNILFSSTFVSFQDCVVDIKNCSFRDTLYAVSFSLKQANKLPLTIRRSLFINNHFCIKVNVESSLETPVVTLSITDSIFQENLGRWDINGSIGLWVKSDSTNPVLVNMTLSNTNFSNNHFGMRGIISVLLDEGIVQLSCLNVNFMRNYATSLKASLYELCGKEVRIEDRGSIYENNTGRVLFLRANDVHAQIRNASLIGHISDASGGVLFVEKTGLVYIYYENSYFLENSVTSQNGGAIGVDDTNGNVTLILKSVVFLGNNAARVGGTAAIGSSSGVDNLTVIFYDVHFNNLNTAIVGGSLYFKSKRKSVFTITRSNFFYNSAGLNGGAITFFANELEMSIHDSIFSFNSCPSHGGAMYLAVTKKLMLDVTNTILTSNLASYGGAVEIAEAESIRMTFSGVQMASNGASEGGAVDFESIKIGFTVSILRSNFTHNMAMYYGGAISMKAKHGELFIGDTVFDNNGCSMNGGSLYLDLERSKVYWHNVSFTRGNSGKSGGAATINFAGSNNLTISESKFLKNGQQSTPPEMGGAIKIVMSLDKLNFSSCLNKYHRNFKPGRHFSKGYRSWYYNNYVNIYNTRFQENMASNGGVIFLQNGKTTFQNCSLINNYAKFQGGSISSTGSSTSITIYNTKLLQTKSCVAGPNGICNSPVITFIHSDSAGPLIVENNTVLAATSFMDVNPMLLVSAGGSLQFDPSALFFCPVGTLLIKQNYSHTFNAEVCYSNQTVCELKVTVLSLSCQKCGLGLYSLQYGNARGLKINKTFECLPCPEKGADCSRNIQAKPNFWGYKIKDNPSKLSFIPCPLHYCKPPNSHNQSVYNGCQGNRSGWLCGACRQGYTETLFSTECRHNSNCYDFWFWFVAGIYILLLSLYLVVKPPLMSWFLKGIWFRNNRSSQNVSQTCTEICNDRKLDSGYLKIIFYYYQVANLLLVTTSVGGILRTHFVLPLVGFFNFQQLFPGSEAGLVCPFPGLNFVTKQLFLSSEVFVVIVFVGLMYLSRFLCGIRKGKHPSSGPYLAAVMEAMLLGYATLASTSLKLLHCVDVESQKRLFFDAHIVCYEWWQILLIAIVAIFFVPFIFLLAFGSVRLYNGNISTKQFLFAAMFPLSFLFFLAFKFVCRICCPNNDDAEPSTNQRQTVREDPLTRMLCDPFRRPEADRNGTLYWESVLIGRRFVLVAMHSLIADPSLRLASMTVACVFILIHHALVRPFRDSKANAPETSSLLSLIVIANLNLVLVSAEAVGSTPNFLGAFIIIESILLGIPIFFVGFFVCLAVVSLVIRSLVLLLCFFVRKFHSETSDSETDKENNESQHLLRPSA